MLLALRLQHTLAFHYLLPAALGFGIDVHHALLHLGEGLVQDVYLLPLLL